MNLVEFFMKINNRTRPGWVETTAVFTGNYRKARIDARPRPIRRDAYWSAPEMKEADYYEYEIRYYDSNDRERLGWYAYGSLQSELIEDIETKKLKIRYQKNRPYNFEIVLNEEETD